MLYALLMLGVCLIWIFCWAKRNMNLSVVCHRLIKAKLLVKTMLNWNHNAVN